MTFRQGRKWIKDTTAKNCKEKKKKESSYTCKFTQPLPCALVYFDPRVCTHAPTCTSKYVANVCAWCVNVWLAHAYVGE